MSTIKVSLDRTEFWEKPTGNAIAKIHNRIGSSVKDISPTQSDIRELIFSVGRDGHTFCPATFKDGKRSKESFEQQQFFALDFDNKDTDKIVSVDDIRARAEHYDLPILFAYDTFSSTEHDKFRVVFLNDASITHRGVAEAVQMALGEIFPEADSSCYKDVSKMYFGGKEVIYQNNTIQTINVDSVFRGLTYHLKDTKGKHYKEKLSKFSKESGIVLNKNGLLDVKITDDPTEYSGASQSNQDGENSPSSIIYSPNIIANGEISQAKYYHVKISDCTSKSSVPTSVSKTDVGKREYKNHGDYRAPVLSSISQGCRLFREFETGKRDMTHDELFAISTNLKHVETGLQRFRTIQETYTNFYDDERRKKWKRHLSYIKQQEYKPFSCDKFCPYRDKCNHGKNILSTVRPRAGMMERIPGYYEEFYSIEDVQKDTYKAIRDAYRAEDNLIHIIKSMTGAGKSYSYLKLMQENTEDRFLISAATNLLKNELYYKALKMGIKVLKTPSLEEIKYEIPHKVWKKIQRLYKSGQHRLVHGYISKLLEKKKIPCLAKYIKEREELKNFHGSIITTHRYLLNMDEERLSEYDAVIIDEDIIFKSILPNQEEIPISKLKKLSKKVTDPRLSKKLKKVAKLAEDQTCIELDGFEYDIEDDDDCSGFDLPSFCQAEKFYVRRSSREPNLREDTVVFLKPAALKGGKYIMVSATVDEKICRYCFGEDRVEFYECKKAKYMGTLNQYPGKSMSRSSIANNPGIVRRLMNRFGLGDERVITFMRENIGHLHFGNTEGSNTLEGKDILVVGTPYHADFLYKLAAFEFGLVFDEDEEMEPQIVTHNGYRFRFTTFKDEDLRAIQFWMLESELEQAAGRARLLRNSCNVHLFSNFPLSQAQMVDGFDYDKE